MHSHSRAVPTASLRSVPPYSAAASHTRARSTASSHSRACRLAPTVRVRRCSQVASEPGRRTTTCSHSRSCRLPQRTPVRLRGLVGRTRQHCTLDSPASPSPARQRHVTTADLPTSCHSCSVLYTLLMAPNMCSAGVKTPDQHVAVLLTASPTRSHANTCFSPASYEMKARLQRRANS